MQHPTLSTMFRQLNEQPQLPEQTKCPTCDSSDTKFCYYNNYNLSQPRYFCKSCRRYWTKESTLRNVPVATKTAVDASPLGPDHGPIRVPAPESGASAGVGSGFSFGSMVSSGGKFGDVFAGPFQLGSGFSFGSMMSSGRKFGLGDVFYGLGHLGGGLIEDNSGSGVGPNRREDDGGDEKMEDGDDDGDEKMEERLRTEECLILLFPLQLLLPTASASPGN